MNENNHEEKQIIVIHKDDSIIFPVITLICYFFVFPLGLILNIVGLITGPQKGCFVAMLVVVLIPALLLFIFVLSLLGISVLNAFY